jgi:hypothetical protein
MIKPSRRPVPPPPAITPAEYVDELLDDLQRLEGHAGRYHADVPAARRTRAFMIARDGLERLRATLVGRLALG